LQNLVTRRSKQLLISGRNRTARNLNQSRLSHIIMASSTKLLVSAALLICLSVIFVEVVEGGKCKYIPFCDACTYDPDTKRATCTQCEPSNLWGLTTMNGFSRCMNCSLNDGCLKCKDFTKCDVCRFQFRDGPDLNGVATCSSCGANCRSCKNAGSGKCDICEAGAVKVGDQCEKCHISNCRYCDSGSSTCSSCIQGYFLENNQCTKCVDNCRSCHSTSTCDYCNDYYFLETDSKTCKPCIDNCRICSDYGQCTFCNSGFFIDSSGKCSACDDSCLTCSALDKCTLCKPGRGKVVDGSCKCAPNCKSCSNVGNGKCDACMDGFVPNGNKQCSKACPENCSSCKNQNQCEVCNTGFSLTDQGDCIGLN